MVKMPAEATKYIQINSILYYIVLGSAAAFGNKILWRRPTFPIMPSAGLSSYVCFLCSKIQVLLFVSVYNVSVQNMVVYVSKYHFSVGF